MSSVRRPRGRLFQIRGPAAPKLLSPKLLCVGLRGTAHTLSKEDGRDRRLPSCRVETDVISQVERHLTTQCLTHQTGEFELHSAPNWKPVQLTQHRRIGPNVVTTSGSGDEACCGQWRIARNLRQGVCKVVLPLPSLPFPLPSPLSPRPFPFPFPPLFPFPLHPLRSRPLKYS